MNPRPTFIRFDPVEDPSSSPELEAVAHFSLDNGLFLSIATYLKPQLERGVLMWRPHLGPFTRSTFGPSGIDHIKESHAVRDTLAGDQEFFDLLHQGATACGYRATESSEEWAMTVADHEKEKLPGEWSPPAATPEERPRQIKTPPSLLDRPAYNIVTCRFGLSTTPQAGKEMKQELLIEMEMAGETTISGTLVAGGDERYPEWRFRTSPVASGYDPRATADFAAHRDAIQVLADDAARARGLHCPSTADEWTALVEVVWDRTLSDENRGDYIWPDE